jgi:hypothetical protein
MFGQTPTFFYGNKLQPLTGKKLIFCIPAFSADLTAFPGEMQSSPAALRPYPKIPEN